MKKITYILLSAAMTVFFGGCQADFEPAVEQADENAITLDAHQGKQVQTRAQLMKIDELKQSGFTIYGYEPGANSYIVNMDAAVAGWDNTGSVWYYNDPNNIASQAQWTGNPLNFIAFAGVSASDLVTPPTAGSSSLRYSVPIAPWDQKDMLVASAQNITKSTAGGMVNLNFTHALSAVVIRAKTAAAGQSVELERLRVIGLSSDGDLDIPTVTWSNINNRQNGLTNVNIRVNDNSTYTDIIPKTDPYMVLPQTTVLGTSKYDAKWQDILNAVNGTEFYIALEWKFTEADGSTAYRMSLCAIADTTGAGITFKPNKIYTLNLILDAYSHKIVFDNPTVEDWDDAPPHSVNAYGIQVGNVIWSHYNVGLPGTFVSSVSEMGYGYMYNKNVAYPCVAGALGIDAAGNTNVPWIEVVNPGAGYRWINDTPCPDGWRIPTNADWNALRAAAISCKRAVVNNQVGAKISLPGGELFMPCMPGRRKHDSVILSTPSYGYYWSADCGPLAPYRQYFYGPGPGIGIATNTADPAHHLMCIRCVKDL
jgi:uncharacterized protein (TIGR02145 family)